MCNVERAPYYIAIQLQLRPINWSLWLQFRNESNHAGDFSMRAVFSLLSPVMKNMGRVDILNQPNIAGPVYKTRLDIIYQPQLG